jgi:hypothetical protein
MPGFAPYILLLLFFAAIVPVALYGARARDVEAEEQALAERTNQRLHRLARIGQALLAGLAALGMLLASALLLLRRRRGNAS